MKRVPRVPPIDRGSHERAINGGTKVAALPLQLAFRQIIVVTTKHVLPSSHGCVVTLYVFISPRKSNRARAVARFFIYVRFYNVVTSRR